MDIEDIAINKKKQILMISNCNFNKGIKDFFILAEKYTMYKFILLTNNKLQNKECEEFTMRNSNHVKIIYDQSTKSKLLKESLFLISMSYYNETFGLILTEALESNTLPISVMNDGSKYCLDRNNSLVFKREHILNEFNSIITYLEKNYNEILIKAQRYILNEFNEGIVMSNLQTIMKKV